MKRYLTLLFLISITATAFSQKRITGTIKGKIVDTVYKQSMADATVSVLTALDSTSVDYAVADAKGNFEITDLHAGKYRLIISFQGYNNYTKAFSVTTNQQVIDLGFVYMTKRVDLLKEVVVERPPIIIKNDTVEFNASSFKTKPYATVEDLIKKLPGMQVDKDGNIKAQGEQIQKVYVDGKEFFGSDPKIATKNLTADMVESVQVYDDMSDQAKFTKIDDGSRQKTINIKLKKDRKKGLFGKINAGIGTDGRYDESLSANSFYGPRQISIIGAGNNVNKQGFSLNDVISSMGGFGGMAAAAGGNSGGGGGGFGGGGFGGAGSQMVATTRTGTALNGGGAFGLGNATGGNTTSWSGGVNYRDTWSKKVEANGSYFFAHTDNVVDQHSYTQSFFPNDSIANQTDNLSSVNRNQNHRFNFRIEYQIDSLNSILYTPSFTIQNSSGHSDDSLYTISQSPKFNEGYLALIGRNYNSTDREGYNINNNVLYRRKLNKPGRTLTLGWNNSINNSNGNGLNQSPYLFFNPDSTFKSKRDVNQQTTQKTDGHNNVLSGSYTEPIGNNKIIEINYAYTNNQSTSDKKTYDYDSLTMKYDSLNPVLTNYFENSYVANRVGANFRLQKKKYNLQVGGGVQFATQQSNSHLYTTQKDSVTTQHFVNFFPTASFNYNYGKGRNLRVNYRGRTNAPTISQLQNVPDLSNPLQIRTGNPNLKQEFNNNLNVTYNTFNLATARYMAVSVNVSNTSNKISSSIDSIANSVQLIKPVNVDGAYNTMGFVTFGLPIKKLKGAMVNLTSILVYNRDISLLYSEKNILNTWIATQGAGFNYNYKDKLDVGVNLNVTYNNVSYSVQKDLNSSYWSQTYSADITYTFPHGIMLGSDFDYFVNTGRSNGFNQNVPMWNANIGKQLFKKKNGVIKLSVMDILKQNQSITRTTTQNYIQDTRTNVLQRYFMLSFIYNFNKFGANPINNMFMPKSFRKSMDNIRITN